MKLDFCFKHVHFTLPALGYADQCYTPALISVFVCLAGLDTLTPNTPLIQLLRARSKLNMDEICSLNIHL